MSARASSSKRRKIEDNEVDEDANAASGGRNKESWEEFTTAVRVIGARISDLTRVVSELGTGVSEMIRINRTMSDTAQELLVEFRDLTWVQHQTKGLLHVVAKRLESLDGVEMVAETGSERKSESEKKMEKGLEIMGQKGKGKEKEVVPESEDANKSEGLEEEEVDEDVVKGPEISTLDVDESMEIEKKE